MERSAAMPADSIASASCSRQRALLPNHRNFRSNRRPLRRSFHSALARAGGSCVNHIAIQHERPLWHRILEFPLVAMLTAIAFFLLARALSIWLGGFVSAGPPASSFIHAAIAFAITLL